MSLRLSYTLIAPFYDAFLQAATRGARRQSLGRLAEAAPLDVLINGVGTGLDLTRAMLDKALPRAAGLDFRAVQGDAQRLPFADASFDAVVLHLILAVVPEPARCLQESARVLRRGGTMLVFDKFLRPGERAVWKRALNPLSRRLATRLDVVFEEVLAAVPALAVESDEPALAGGWFRLLRLKKP